MLEYEPERRITLTKALEHEFFHLLPEHYRIQDEIQAINKQTELQNIF